MEVPFLDLKIQYESIRDEIGEAIQRVLDSCAFANGPFVAQFENEYSDFCQTQHAIAVNSGTTALWLCLKGLSIGRGDEVITVPNTFIATAEAISLTGATPVFVDIDESTYNMNPALLEGVISSKTRAIIPVHLFGQMADMNPILEVAESNGLYVIEDACQAQGSRYKDKSAGSIGRAGCFSFYPGKNLGAYGEAGVVTTNNPDLAEKICMLRDHGQSRKYVHSLIGLNGRLDGLQGAILSVKLRQLNRWNKARCNHAHLYNELLADVENITTPYDADYGRHIYHIYAVRAKNRDSLMKALAEKGIACATHYPFPIHLTKAYEFLGLKKGSFPIAEKCADELLSLPMFPELQEEQIKYVADNIKRFMS